MQENQETKRRSSARERQQVAADKRNEVVWMTDGGKTNKGCVCVGGGHVCVCSGRLIEGRNVCVGTLQFVWAGGQQPGAFLRARQPLAGGISAPPRGFSLFAPPPTPPLCFPPVISHNPPDSAHHPPAPRHVWVQGADDVIVTVRTISG